MPTIISPMRLPAVFLLILLSVMPCMPSIAVGAEPPRDAASEIAPEAATASNTKALVHARKWMVASANPLASEAGRDVLRAGGSAVDAAIAMQMVLALVEPQSSGLGGGAFMVSYDAKRRRIITIDGRETAPAAATPQLFMKDGKPLAYMDAVNSGMAVGVPGVLRALELAHQRHGRLPWARLMQPATRLAEQGFAVSPRLHAQIKGNRFLAEQAAARAYFYPQGQPAPIGHVLKNPALADVLRRIASEGVAVFYRGDIAQDIVQAVHSHARPGVLTLQDLAEYRAIVREPVCGDYRRYRLCGMGPPSSGAIAVIQMLGMLQQHDMASILPGSREAVHYFAEAGRLAFADRERYVTDPAYIQVPVAAMLDSRYLAWRGALIDARRSMGVAQPGDPLGMLKQRGESAAIDQPSTTHLVVIDAESNAVSMTSTIESEFGSKIFVRGFLLNNQLTDFSLSPTDAQGRLVANRVEPRKRPRSSMAPIIVLKDDKPYLLIGSPGGSSIILYVAKTLIGALDWQLDIQQAITLPNMGSRNRETELEQGSALESLQQPLRQSGHRVSIAPSPSGVHAIMIQPDALYGGADPRREGVALGD